MDVKLVMFKADGHRKDFPIINTTTVIGRGEECDLRVPLLSVSRKHCEVTVGEKVKVKDLASSNGTYVNNRRVNEQALSPGDRLVVGPIVFTVQVDGQPQEIRPVKMKPQAKAGQPEEVVELEADVVGAEETGEEELVEDGPEEEIDVISALEMMAGEPEKKKKKP